MLKRFLKGLGVAFACSYALASPQNTIFLNESVKKEKIIIDQDEFNYNYFIFTDDGFNIAYSFDILTMNDAKLKIEVIDYDHEDVLKTYNFNFNDDLNSNGSYRLFLTSYYEDLNYNNTTGAYFFTSSYKTDISYNNINNTFYFSNATQTTFLDIDERMCNVSQALSDQLYIKLYFENCYILDSDYYNEDTRWDFVDMLQYYLNAFDKKIDYFKFINYINNYMGDNNIGDKNQAYNNGYNDGYDEGFNTGVSMSNNYDQGFNDGYAQGIGDNIVPKNIIGWFRIISRGVQSVLDIEILPYMKVGYIISIPIMFGLILFIIRLVRGD